MSIEMKSIKRKTEQICEYFQYRFNIFGKHWIYVESVVLTNSKNDKQQLIDGKEDCKKSSKQVRMYKTWKLHP